MTQPDPQTTDHSGYIVGFILGLIIMTSYWVGHHYGYKSGVHSVFIEPLDPISDFGAQCDGHHDDTASFYWAAKLSAKLGASMKIPDMCVLRDLEIPHDR